MPEIKVREIYLKLHDNPEISAERIYKFLRTLPMALRKNLQTIIDDLLLTKSLKEDYSMSDSGD